MDDDFFRYLLPSQRPGEWTPDAPIDLLPAFQQCYPGCMADDLLALQLFNADHPARITWVVRIVRVGRVDLVPVADEAHRHSSDGYDYCDGPLDAFPLELIDDYLNANRMTSLQETMQLFKPSAFEMLARVKMQTERLVERQMGDEVEYTARQHQDRADFLRELALVQAKYLSNRVDLVSPVVSRFKVETSFGVRAELEASRWEEIGAEAFEPSILHEQVLEDVRVAVYRCFQSLDEEEKLAIWFKAMAEKELRGGRHLLDWDVPSGPSSTWRRGQMDDHFNDVASTVMSKARDDYYEGRERLPPPDEDA